MTPFAIRIRVVFVGLLGIMTLARQSQSQTALDVPPPVDGVLRVATFNVSLHRTAYRKLAKDLQAGDPQAERLAKVIHAVQPDVLLVNEIDFDGGTSATLFLDKYLANSSERSLRYVFTSESNTGIPSSMDLDNDGKVSGPNDAFGFGQYPGQYGLAVYSRYPILDSEVQSFQKFLWQKMPDALRPMNPDGTPFWKDDIWNNLRLSSKTHLDVPIEVRGKRLHVLALHPTPPVFDGPEDRNGCRNHDEIRLISDYANGGKGSEYLESDQGRVGPLDETESFVIVGDLNADPNDGSGRSEAIKNLLQSRRVSIYWPPRSHGGAEAAEKQGGANQNHRGDPAEDTGDFNDRNPGNLRCDFVLPSNDCVVVASGVFWPTEAALAGVDPELLDASDHRLVWVDIQLP